MSIANSREVVLDTETTGKSERSGDRVVEIAAIEIVNGEKTGRVFHTLINPDRDIPDEVVRVHGITNEKVKNSPKFKDIMPDFISFIRGAKIVGHNVIFDEKFLNNELSLAGHPESFWAMTDGSICTMQESRRIWVGKQYRHSLDALLDRLSVDRSQRDLHSALLDTQLTVDAYLKIKAIKAESGPQLYEEKQRDPVKYIADPPAIIDVSAFLSSSNNQFKTKAP